MRNEEDYKRNVDPKAETTRIMADARCSKEVTDLAATLKSRGARYGKFVDHAGVTQALKTVCNSNQAHPLTPSEAEALDMILHKIGRIVTGDPHYADSWHDIAGYAKLVDDELQGVTV